MILSDFRSKPWQKATVKNPRITFISAMFGTRLTTVSQTRSRSEEVQGRLTDVSHWNYKKKKKSQFSVFLAHSRPANWGARWPRSVPVKLSSKRGNTVDLIWSSVWTHDRPQLDVSWPQHAITGEPNTLISYIKIWFPKLDIDHQTKHCLLY